MLEEMKREILDQCTACGTCAEVCPSVSFTDMNSLGAAEIQEALLDFIRDPQPSKAVSRRIAFCLECFLFTDVCPEGLNPLSLIETAKALSLQTGYPPYAHASLEGVSLHRAALVQALTSVEKARVCVVSGDSHPKFLFFPGCNIYKSPKRVLRARAIARRSEDFL